MTSDRGQSEQAGSIPIEQVIRSLKPERSLLLTYCAGLSFFEARILRPLQTEGIGSVTVLMDSSEYASSFSDVVTGAGTHYELHPVRMPQIRGRFHPKIYVFIAGESITLLLGSGNLTPAGLHSNLEIFEHLQFDAEHTTNAPAFVGLASMLRRLSDFDSHMPDRVRKELNGIAAWIEMRVAAPSTPDTSIQLLHNLDESLYAQIKRLIPSQSVTEIVGISPFYDDACAATLSLAHHYEDASVQLIMGTDTSALNGRKLGSLGARITVHQCSGLTSEDVQRRLHAKLLLFRGNGFEWTISGSANLTRAAILDCATDPAGGNCESVILRQVEQGTIDRLLENLKTVPIDHMQLHSEGEASPAQVRELVLVVIDAELIDDSLCVTLRAEQWMPAIVSISVELEQDGRRVAVWQSHVPRAQEHDEFRFGFTPREVTYDVATIVNVTVEALGIKVSARRWLSVITSLRMDARQRNISAAVKRMCEEVLQGDTAHFVAGAISRFLASLADPDHVLLSTSEIAFASLGTSDNETKETDDPVHHDDFAISDADLSFLRKHGRAISSTVLSLSAALTGLFLPAFEDLEQEDIDVDNQDSDNAESPEEGKPPENDDANRRKLKAAEDLLVELHSGFCAIAKEVLDYDIEPKYVRIVLGLLDGVIAYVRFHDELAASLAERTLVVPDQRRPNLALDLLKRVAAMSVSLDGVYAGGYPSHCGPAIAPAQSSRRTLHRRSPSACRPAPAVSRPLQSRWSLLWPLLPVACVPNPLAYAVLSRLTSGSH